MRRLLLCTALLLAGCGATSHPASRIRVASPAFAGGGRIPRVYTCDGRDISPPLRWSGVPAGTRSLSLTVRDPDASFLHWTVAGIHPAITALAAGQVPVGATQGRNDFGKLGYGGPCPPAGQDPHHYVFTLTAVGAGGRVLATGKLVGSYGR